MSYRSILVNIDVDRPATPVVRLALDLAKRFGGGGHRNSAGARLASHAVFSQAEAVRQFREVVAAEPAPAGTTWQA